MSIHYQDDRVTLHHGDCLDVLATLPDNSVDSVVTDPPYGLSNTDPGHVAEALTRWVNGERDYLPSGAGFMGKAWDAFVPPPAVWDDCFRVLKPGGHLLVFAGTRTQDLMGLSIRLAGFDIRDSIAWLYASGFPKSHDVSKAIDKVNGEPDRLHRFTAWMRSTGVTASELDKVTGTSMGSHYLAAASQPAIPTPALWSLIRPLIEEVPEWVDLLVERIEAAREVVSIERRANEPPGIVGVGQGGRVMFDRKITAPATPDAQRWQGWGTALKPGHEPVVCARKPLSAVPLWSEVNDLHHMIGGLLWLSLSPAKRADLASPSSPAEQHAATCVSALVSAATAKSPGGFAETGTCSSPATASTSSSIASSWSGILEGLSARTSTSTTSTRSSTTTALSTLSSLLAPLTSPNTMPPCACLTSGSSSSAPSAAETSTDEWASWLHTLSASVPESAIEGTALVVANALAQAAAELSTDRPGSSAAPSAITGADASPSPAHEPVIVARKPLDGTVASNVLQWGTGALNIDGGRVGTEERTYGPGSPGGHAVRVDRRGRIPADNARRYAEANKERPPTTVSGRWPANVIVDEDQARALDEQSGERPSGKMQPTHTTAGANGRASAYGKDAAGGFTTMETYGDTGGGSRFFFCAKADTNERPKIDGVTHPTVKPMTLMRHLVRLVTPPGGTVLEPFAGSGTTVEACLLEGLHCIASENWAEYLPLILARIHRQRNPVEAIKLAGGDLGLFDGLYDKGA